MKPDTRSPRVTTPLAPPPRPPPRPPLPLRPNFPPPVGPVSRRGGIRDLVVAGEFSEEEVVCPIVLKVTDVRPKVLFHDCIHMFGLSVSLRMEGRREAGIDLGALAQVVPEA